MTKIDKWFLEKAKEVSFIELKDGSSKIIGDYRISAQLPLPINTKKLLEDVRRGTVEDEIQIDDVVDGIIYILGTDPDFKYNKEYEKLLAEVNSNIEAYILYEALKLLEKEDYILSAIYLSALIYLDKKTEVVLFNYSMSLENIGMALSEESSLREEFLIRSTNLLEEILDINEKFSLAYYKLGYHYRAGGQFLKAKLTWENYLSLDDDHSRKDLIRDELLEINNDVKFEESIIAITNGQYDLALNKLLDLKDSSDWWNIYYLIGLCYKELNMTEDSIVYFEKSVELGGQESILFNELGISYFVSGRPDQAIKSFDQALELDQRNYESYYNRAIVYSQLGDFSKAMKDMEAAYSLSPNNPQVREQYERMKHNI